MAIALIGCLAGRVAAQPAVPSQGQAAATLVMPFDASTGFTSFAIVSRVGPSLGANQGLRTDWVYYAADCRHLVDFSITLTQNDTVVVDANHVQSSMQLPGEPENVPLGPVLDLKGERGVLIVTADVPATAGAARAQLVGGWTIASLEAGVAFGTDAFGFRDGVLPDPSQLSDEGLLIPTFNPTALDLSEVIVIGLEESGGTLEPIDRASAALHGAHACCHAALSDNLETVVSIPDVCFACALFAPLAPTTHPSGGDPIAPIASAASAGMLHLTACRTADRDGSVVPLGTGHFRQFLVAFHGQAIGPFGFATSGKYATAATHAGDTRAP